jgi:hypothetical protein
MKLLKLIILFFTVTSLVSCSNEEIYMKNQKHLTEKDLKFKRISYDEFNQKTAFFKNKPNFDGMVLENGKIYARENSKNSEYIIYTDKISEIITDDYISYTMLLKTPKSSENIFFNIIFEIKNDITSIFIVKYSKSKNGAFEHNITTYRSSEENYNNGANILQMYIDNFDGVSGSIGETGTFTSISGGMPWLSFGGSTTYPTNCNGTINTTYILEPHACASGNHLPGQSCEYLNPSYSQYNPSNGPYYELVPYYTCVPKPIDNINNPPSNGNNPGGGSTAPSIDTNISITTIVNSDNDCLVPRGDLNNDCVLDQDEANFLNFLDNLNSQERQLVLGGDNKMSFFNYLKVESWSNESLEFSEWAINHLINNSNLTWNDIFESFLRPYPEIETYIDINPNDITYDSPLTIQNLPTLASFTNNFPKKGSNGNYSQMSASDVYSLAGGSLLESYNTNPSSYSNACSIRGSRGLLYSNIQIPVLKYNGTQRTQKGGDLKNYILDAVSFNKYMIDKFGDTNFKLEGIAANDPEQAMNFLSGKNGIYVIINNNSSPTNGAGYSGHVDLILNGNCVGNEYLRPKGGVKSIRIWVLN